MSLEKSLQSAASTIPECVASGYVDMGTGMLLAVKTVDSHPAEVLDLLAAATSELFQGQSVVAIEKLFRRARGLPGEGGHYFQEIVIFSENLIHIFMRGKKHQNHATVFVCRGSANVGMIIAKSRLALPSIENAL